MGCATIVKELDVVGVCKKCHRDHNWLEFGQHDAQMISSVLSEFDQRLANVFLGNICNTIGTILLDRGHKSSVFPAIHSMVDDF